MGGRPRGATVFKVPTHRAAPVRIWFAARPARSAAAALSGRSHRFRTSFGCGQPSLTGIVVEVRAGQRRRSNKLRAELLVHRRPRRCRRELSYRLRRAPTAPATPTAPTAPTAPTTSTARLHRTPRSTLRTPPVAPASSRAATPTTPTELTTSTTPTAPTVSTAPRRPRKMRRLRRPRRLPQPHRLPRPR